jgi:hypothetical protein
MLCVTTELYTSDYLNARYSGESKFICELPFLTDDSFSSDKYQVHISMWGTVVEPYATRRKVKGSISD